MMADQDTRQKIAAELCRAGTIRIGKLPTMVAAHIDLKNECVTTAIVTTN
jgi:hypothetical protein